MVFRTTAVRVYAGGVGVDNIDDGGAVDGVVIMVKMMAMVKMIGMTMMMLVLIVMQ